MSGFPILDLVVGVIFVFFLLSIICSSIVEIILTLTRTRAKVLEDWFLQIFNKEVTDSKGKLISFGRELLDHCATTALARKVSKSKPLAKATGPSYVDAKNFVSALLSKVFTHQGKDMPTDMGSIITTLKNDSTLPSELRQSCLLFGNEVQNTVEDVKQRTVGAIEMFEGKLENWYNSTMDRLTGALKSMYTRRFTMISGVVLVLFLNADTIAISKYLYSNDDARTALAVKAYAAADDKDLKAEVEHIRDVIKGADSTKVDSVAKLDSILQKRVQVIKGTNAALQQSIPLGWNTSQFAANTDVGDWILFILSKLVGMAVTVLALMMGAPFWFDVLNKISNLRGNGPKPPTATDDKK